MKTIRPKASALVITLALIVLITILVTGFMVQTRLEVSTARSHVDGVRAGLYAQAGVDTALDQLSSAISGTGKVWLSQPGRIAVLAGGTTTVVDLSSGAMPTNASADSAANLNLPQFADPSHGTLAFTTDPMRVSWIYVRQNGSLETNAPAVPSPANPVVGRYAYWVDDESTKININTAWIKASQNASYNASTPTSYPSLVDLTALCANVADADAVRSYRLTNHFFNTADEVGQVNTNWKAIAAQHRDLITQFNHAPDLNMFGEPRIMLTTSTNLAGGTNCLDILSGTSDPGNFVNLNAAKVANVYSRLYAQMTRKDWPFMPGHSLAEKYAPMDVGSICLNIIDYVRSVESTNALVEPLRGTISSGTFSLNYNGGYDFGNCRRILISEMGAYVSDTLDATGNWKVNFWLRVYLPPDGGVSSLDLTSLQLLCNLTQLEPPNPSTVSANPHGMETRILSSEITAGGSVMHAGEYRTIERSFTIPGNPAKRPTKMSFQIAIANPANASAPKRYDVVLYQIYGVDPVGTAETAIQSVAPDDPVLHFQNDWIRGTNQFASTSTSHFTTLGRTPAAISPQQDTDGSGVLTSAGMHIPPPKGQPGNLLGVVCSVGELGYIHSGMSSTMSGAPWRTLRLQPQSAGTNVLPDWALLDLFTVPTSVSAPDKNFVLPFTNTVGGRININNQIQPFTKGDGSPLLSRDTPLVALMLNSGTGGGGKLDTNTAASLAQSMQQLALAANGRMYGNTNFFYSAGQVCEILGVADHGEASEALIRSVAGLASVQSDVFSIVSVGQAVRENPAGGITVLAERRYQKFFERTSTGAIAPLFSKDLTP